MPPQIPVPKSFDAVDDTVDNAWEPLRRSDAVNSVFYTASEAANFSRIWHALGIIAALATRDPKRALRASAALGFEAALVNGPIKSLFQRQRPHVEDRPRNLRQPKTSSFPSGHASAAVVASSFLNPGMPRPWRWAVNALAAIVATSRVHVQIHHATDVAAGAATGWALARVAQALLRRIGLSG